MSKARIELIRWRTEEATPGPWKWNGNCDVLRGGDKFGEAVGKCLNDDEYGMWFDMFDRNAEFIAHAREDVPYLLSQVDHLTKQNKALQKRNWQYIEVAKERQYRVDLLQEEIERLREQIGEIELQQKADGAFYGGDE